MDNTQNENDFKVVTFRNVSTFEFTPALGAMFNSRPIFGKAKVGCIDIGEELFFPYHIGHRLAVNLAKQILVRQDKPVVYGEGDPSRSQALFGDEAVNAIVRTVLVGEYKEEAPAKESETDILMRKFEDLNKKIAELEGSKTTSPKVSAEGYQDKQEVIAELEKRGIAHDKRANKATLEKLLA